MAPTAQQPTVPEEPQEPILRSGGEAVAESSIPASTGVAARATGPGFPAPPLVRGAGSEREPATAQPEPQSAPSNVTAAATPPAPPTTANSSVARMARLRQLVRTEGMDAETAAHEVGVDPIIAQLWLRLPDDLWPGFPPAPLVRAGGTPAPTAAPLSTGQMPVPSPLDQGVDTAGSVPARWPCFDVPHPFTRL